MLATMMKRQKEEKRIADVLAEELRKADFEVYTRISLASRKYYSHWEKYWEAELMPYAQPDIDLLLVDRRRQLLAIEVKYLKRKRITYYAGIGEALALLRFGFLSVSLWLCFSEKVPLEEARRCGRITEELIRALGLPINFSAIRVMESGEGTQLKEIVPNSPVEKFKIPSLYGKENPFRETQQAKRAEEFLRMVLKIPKPEPSVEEKLKAMTK